MSELPWGNKKEKEDKSPFDTEDTGFLLNKAVIPIVDPKNKDQSTIADSNIRINPVDLQDPKPEVLTIDGIEDQKSESFAADTSFFLNIEKDAEDLEKTNSIQKNINEGLLNGITATTNEETTPEEVDGSKKRSLPLFEPDIPAENDINSSFLPYGNQAPPNEGPNNPPQYPEGNPFKNITENTASNPFKPPEIIKSPQANKERETGSGSEKPIFPPSTPNMAPDLKTEVPEANREISKNGKGIIGLITDTFKRFTHKKKLLDRMEEWQPPVAEVQNGEEIPEPVKRNVTPYSDKKGTIPYENTGSPTLEEIRTVIPIDPQNIQNAPEWEASAIQFENFPLEGTAEIAETENTINLVDPGKDPNIGNSSKDIQKIKDELILSKQGNEDLSKDIKNISDTINTLEGSINSMKKDEDKCNSIINMRVDESTEKIEILEERLNGFESRLESIQTDNIELKAGISNIEQNIMELTGSYGIMLDQMQKLTEFGNSRSAEIFETNNRIDELDQTLATMNSVQAETQKSMLELHSVTSDLIKSVENTHHANKELRSETEEQAQFVNDEILSLTDFVEKELKNLGARSYRANGENVQLNNIIKNSTNMKLCMEWLEFLMELVGQNHLADILSYYEELGWISEDVRLELMRYAEGIDYYIEKSDWKLAPDDHVKSIWFIEQLAGLKVDKNRLSIVEKNIKKVKKGTEIYGI